jgi:hypothetical protein
MPKKAEVASGQISFRLPVELHARVLDVSRRLGQDITSLMNRIVREALPGLLEEATRQAANIARAAEDLDAAYLSRDDPTLIAIYQVAKSVPPEKGEDRLRTLTRAALEKVNGPADQIERYVLEAKRFLEEEDARRTIHEFFTELARESAGGKKGRKS